MIVNATNITEEIISLSAISINLVPNVVLDLLDSATIFELQSCSELFNYITSNNIIISDGVNQLSSISAIKYLMNESLAPTSLDGKPQIHQSSRPANTTTCWMGCGDDLASPADCFGKGEPVVINHRIGEQDSPIYIDFLTIDNTTYIHEGHVSYGNAVFDKIYCQIVPQIVDYTSGTNTNYQTYNGIIVPAAGTGDVDLDPAKIILPNGGLVQVKYDENGTKTSAGFWNADWNSETKQFDDIAPVADGSGEYNFFYYEMLFATFVIDHLFGSGSQLYQSSDVDRLWHGMRIRVLTETCGLDWNHENIEDHDWQMTVRFTMHRTRLT